MPHRPQFHQYDDLVFSDAIDIQVILGGNALNRKELPSKVYNSQLKEGKGKGRVCNVLERTMASIGGCMLEANCRLSNPLLKRYLYPPETTLVEQL